MIKTLEVPDYTIVEMRNTFFRNLNILLEVVKNQMEGQASTLVSADEFEAILIETAACNQRLENFIPQIHHRIILLDSVYSTPELTSFLTQSLVIAFFFDSVQDNKEYTKQLLREIKVSAYYLDGQELKANAERVFQSMTESFIFTSQAIGFLGME